MGERVFKVIDGGAGSDKTVATYIETSAADEGGGGGGGDGVNSIFKLDVARDVQWMKAGWAVLIPALGAFLFYFISEMKDVRHDISAVDSKVAAQSATLSDIAHSLDRIELRLDTQNGTQPQASARTGKTGTVRR